MRSPERFPRGARVAFIGDSITNQGVYMANIQEYYMTHFPEDEVKCFNLGVSGGCVDVSALRYFDYDMACFRPTHAVIMLGMNDLWRGLYTEEGVNNTRKKMERNEVYFDGMATLCEKLHALGIPFILCTPTPFDDEMECAEPAGKNLAMALTAYGYFCRGLAEKYGAPIVDYNTEITHLNRELQLTEPTASLISPDRVHPTLDVGHSVIARIFLRAQGFTDVEEPTVEAYRAGKLLLPPLSEKNKKRFDTEQIARNIRLLAYFTMGDSWQKPLEERIAAVKKSLAAEEAVDPNSWMSNLLRDNIQYLDKEEQYIKDVLSLTDALYE
jgi:lysophospholipase L1-like esterase